MEIKIAKIAEGAVLPDYQSSGAACFDFYALEKTIIDPQSIAKIRTGLVIEVPRGSALLILPRSSTPGLGLRKPHSIGVVDSDYRGQADEVLIMLENTTSKPITVETLQRVAQGCVVRTPKVKWREISKNSLARKNRGGFGKTGKK